VTFYRYSAELLHEIADEEGIVIEFDSLTPIVVADLLPRYLLVEALRMLAGCPDA